jgi:hypothetical protein
VNSLEEYVTSLETNAMIFGIVAPNVKNSACLIIQHVNGRGSLDNVEFAKSKHGSHSRQY